MNDPSDDIDDEPQDDPEDNPCGYCGGLLVFLGQLGNVRWFRCRDCGVQSGGAPMTRPCDKWADMLREARTLDDAELRRHASVSTSNRHACVSCFTCACETVRQERMRAHRTHLRSIDV